MCGLPTPCGERGNNRNTTGKCSQYRELGEQVRLGFMESEGMAQRMLLFSCSVVSQLFSNPWTAACQACLTSTISQSLLKLKPIDSVMPSNHLSLCCSLLLLPSIFPRNRVFSNESALCIRWPTS